MSLDKLYAKYAAKSPIRPPAPEEEVELDIPSLGGVPKIEDLSPEDMIAWEEYIAKQRQPKALKDLERTKEIVDIGKEEKASEEKGTMPAIPKKKSNLSPDTLLKMCSQYHDLCRKF